MPEPTISLLWVDDDIDELPVYVQALKDSGVSVTPAKSCTSAVKHATKTKFTAFLVDILMPAPDGIETLRRLHKSQPKTLCAVLSSFLYLDKYREQLRSLDFKVELIDKDMCNVESPDFEARFIAPVRSLIKNGVTQTISSQDELLRKSDDDNPFEITLDDFMRRPILEKDRLLQRARQLANPIIEAAFAKGCVWVLLCGSKSRISAGTNSLQKIPKEAKIMNFARIQNSPPFQFFKPMTPEELGGWCSTEQNTLLKNYPTITLEIGDERLGVHFDTGSPWTYFSYEELVRLGKLTPTSVFGESYIWSHKVNVVNLDIEVMLRCQISGETYSVRLRGIAVRNWLKGPLARYCKEKCKYAKKKNPFNVDHLCESRKGLIGRNLLMDNRLVMTLDGVTCKTGIKQKPKPKH